MKIDLGDQSLVKLIIGANVGNHRADQIIDVAAQAVEIHDLGKTDHDLSEFLHPLGVVLVGLDGDENADTEVQPFRIEQLTPRFSLSASSNATRRLM